MRGRQDELPQGREVDLHHRPRRLRQRSSIVSNSSSLSSYSPPWVMTPHPQSQSTAWPTDALTVEPAPAQNNSTWQEEAHWMSFRNAIYFFAAQTLQEKGPGLDESQRTRRSENTPTSFYSPPPVQHVVGGFIANSSKHETSQNGDVYHDSLATSACGISPTHSQPTSEVTTDHCLADDAKEDSDEKEDGPNKDQQEALLKSMASDLAETKMRLALAQAERDELEFALLMGGATDSRSRSQSGGS